MSQQKLFMIYYGDVPAGQVMRHFSVKGYAKEGNAKIKLSQFKSFYSSCLEYYTCTQPIHMLKDGTLIDLEKFHIVEFVPNQSNIIEQLLNYIGMSYRGDLDEYHFAEIEAIANGLGFIFDDNCYVQREEE